MYYTYIVLCSDNTYYIGSTNNLEKRIHEHNTSKKGAHYTKIRRPVALVYSKAYSTYREARATEASWKRLTRKQKSDLVQRGI
jgi:putative endonuclease